jgi:hypothetical protein
MPYAYFSKLPYTVRELATSTTALLQAALSAAKLFFLPQGKNIV